MAARKLRTVRIPRRVDCQICMMEFPSARPNEGKYDGQIRALGGTWGYACSSHRGYLTKETITKLEVR